MRGKKQPERHVTLNSVESPWETPSLWVEGCEPEKVVEIVPKSFVSWMSGTITLDRALALLKIFDLGMSAAKTKLIALYFPSI